MQTKEEEHKIGIMTGVLRNSTGVLRWGVLIGAAVLILAVGLVAGIWGTSSSSSSASAHTARVHARANGVLETQGWTLYNHSNYTVEYEGADSPDGGGLENGGPQGGSRVNPGQSMHFEQVYEWHIDWSGTTVNLNFRDLATERAFTFSLYDSGVNKPSASAGHDVPGLYLTVDSDNRALNIDNE